MSQIAQRLTEILSRYRAFRLAILFGSQAGGIVTPDSDIDLALLADSPIESDLKLELMEKIGLELGRSVDIVDLYYAPEPVLGQVFKGQRLLGDNATYAKLLTTHLLNAADFLPLRERILKQRRDAWIR